MVERRRVITMLIRILLSKLLYAIGEIWFNFCENALGHSYLSYSLGCEIMKLSCNLDIEGKVWRYITCPDCIEQNTLCEKCETQYG